METVESKEDWKWYTQKLDVDAKYAHWHEGEPTRYPCKVSSEWQDDSNGPDTFIHHFTYQRDKTCESCGHKTKEWDV